MKTVFKSLLVILALGLANAHAINTGHDHSEIFTITDSSLTVSGSTSTWVDTSAGDYDLVDFYVSVSSVTGTASPTLTPVIQLSPDGGTTWFNHGSVTFTAITSTTTVTKLSVDCGGATKVRLNYTISGTNPMLRTKVWGQVKSR